MVELGEGSWLAVRIYTNNISLLLPIKDKCIQTMNISSLRGVNPTDYEEH